MRLPKPDAFGCRVCNKIDWADTDEAQAKPEHVPHRGYDIGSCKGEMVKLWSMDSLMGAGEKRCLLLLEEAVVGLKHIGWTGEQIIGVVRDA